ncbi:hypothetical protein Tco_1262495 [Tanacetum coccineum]
MEADDTLSSCLDSEEQKMQQIQDKAKKSCMVSFRLLHSHLKVLSNNDLKETRTEHGFTRAFAKLFRQDVHTFINTMFLNVDQLEKQLDKEEFQEIGSMAAFRVLKTQFQKFINSRISLDDDDGLMTRKEYDNMVNDRQMQTTEEKVDTSKALDASLVDIESKQQHTEQPKFINEGKVDQNAEQCHDTRKHGQFLKEKSNEAKVTHDIDEIETINIELEHSVAKLLAENEWVPTRKIFASSTTKVDSESPHGSNTAITNPHECKQSLDLSAGTEDGVTTSLQQSHIHHHMLMLKLQRYTISIKIQESRKLMFKDKDFRNSDIQDLP